MGSSSLIATALTSKEPRSIILPHDTRRRIYSSKRACARPPRVGDVIAIRRLELQHRQGRLCLSRCRGLRWVGPGGILNIGIS